MVQAEEQKLQPQTRRRNIEQKRGQQAWKNVSEIRDIVKLKNNEKLEKEYRSQARGLNAMIQINGLGQTLGFLKAKGENNENKASYLLLKHLTEWMQGHFIAANSRVLQNGYDGLLKWVIDEQTSSADYRRATTECMAFGMWLRRFAEGELKAPKTVNTDSLS